MTLHINIEDLLSARTVESDRIEYKLGWNPDAIYRSICAFANDLENIGGGYIIIGVSEDEKTRTAKRPVEGLSTNQIADIQTKMIGFNNLLEPVYHPKLTVEEVDDKQIIVIWVPGGPNRPYRAPEQITAKRKQYHYYIRRYANTVKADSQEERELIELSNNIPFDDRANTEATVSDVSMVLVKDYLTKIKSRLAESVGVVPDVEVLRQMELLTGPDEHVYPRNVALMMFAQNPERFFPYTQVEIVEFPKGDAGEYFEHPPITGPIDVQIKRTLSFLKDKLIKGSVFKFKDVEESNRTASYPFQAFEETLVNCLYHRDYQLREPVEIRVYQNSVIFINQGGPDRSIKLENFNKGRVRSRRYRNRRLGEFLKELNLTEGRATGIPTILNSLEKNGSPAPNFYSDDDRTFFEVEIFIHPSFKKKAIVVDLESVEWNLEGVNELLGQLIDGGRGGEAVVEPFESLPIDDQLLTVIGSVGSGIAGGVAGGVAEAQIEKRFYEVLNITQTPASRSEILEKLNLSLSNKNSDEYIKPLIEIGWLEMTIPDKPTSPNQRYRTTLKGKLFLALTRN